MSKTTTVANTKTLRGAQPVVNGPSHHVIARGKNETKSLKDIKERHVQGYAAEKSSRERNENRISIRNNAAENNRSKSKADKSSEKQNKCSAIAAENDTPEAGSNLKKMPIEDYYKQGGIDYRLLRKNCRIRVNGEGSGAKGEAAVFVDFYQLPEGYTVDDLPDSQGAVSQNIEDPLSPAVMIAAYHKKQRTKVMTLTPDSTDTNEIIRRIQMGRRCKKNGSDSVQSNTVNLKQSTDSTDFFPDNSLNDSDLIMASQQAENQLEISNDNGKITSKEKCKRDINGNSKKSSPPTPSLPLTSTPLPELVKNVIPVKETPKTARAVSRSRNRSSGQVNNPVFEKSIFENSVDNEHLDSSVDGEGDASARKVLKFDESPIKNVIFEKEIVCDGRGDQFIGGDFDDDNEDELFSQVEIPGEIRIPKPCVSESSAESVNSAQMTLLMDEGSNGEADTNCGEMDSYLDADALDAIAKLEAIHCTSSGSTGNSTENSNNDKAKTKTASSESTNKLTQKKETPRTRARRVGLSRKVNVR